MDEILIGKGFIDAYRKKAASSCWWLDPARWRGWTSL